MAFIIADSPWPECSAYKILLKITKSISYSKTSNLDWKKEVTYSKKEDQDWQTSVSVNYNKTPSTLSYRLWKGEQCATTPAGEPWTYHPCPFFEPYTECYDFPANLGATIYPSNSVKSTIYIRKKTNKISAGTCLAEYKTTGNNRYRTCTMTYVEYCPWSAGYEIVMACVQTDSPSITNVTSLATLRQLGSTRTMFSAPVNGSFSKLEIGTFCKTDLGYSTSKSPCNNTYACLF